MITRCVRCLIACVLTLTCLLMPGNGQVQSVKPPVSSAPVPKEERPRHRDFLKIEDRNIVRLGKVLYRNVGVNIPDLFERFLRGNDAEGVKALKDAKAAGVHLVRFWGTTWAPDGFSAFESQPDRWFGAWDRMLEAADAADIAVVPSLLFNLHMLPQYVGRSDGKPDTLAQYLTPGSRSNRLAVRYVTEIVKRYRNDARVLFWEIGNEYNLEADLSTQVNGRPSGDVVTSDQIRAFLIQFAQLIHDIDKHHYVTSGNDNMRPSSYHLRAAMLRGKQEGHLQDFAPDWAKDSYSEYSEMLGLMNPAPLDIISVHMYPTEAVNPLDKAGMGWIVDDGLHALRLPWTQYAAQVLRRPLFIGEFGQKFYHDGVETEAPWMLDLLRRLEASEAPFSAVWSWEFDLDNPEQSALGLSPQRTPKMVVALANVNSGLFNSAVRTVPTPKASPADVAQGSKQEEKLQTQAEQIHKLAVTLLKASEGKIGTVPVHFSNATPTPEVNATTNRNMSAFVVRDAALMLGSDLIGADELANWVKLIASKQAGPNGLMLQHGLTVPAYSIPEQIEATGEAIFFPGGKPGEDQGDGSRGYLPPADNPFFFIQMVREHLQLTNSPSLFQTEVKTDWGTTTIAQVCERAFNSIPVDSKGLVVIGAGPRDARADWGFADTVHKTGGCLMPSVLRWRAAKDLVQLYAAVGDRNRLERYNAVAVTLRASINDTFYRTLTKANGKETTKEVGMLMTATGDGNGKRDDLWASAYALWSGALRSRQAAAVAKHLLEVYQAGGAVVDGHVRPLPPANGSAGYWERSLSPQDTHQNGAFWAFPTGWYASALLPVDRSAAAKILDDFLISVESHQKEGAPWQCIFPATGYTHEPRYVPSVAVPAVALQALRKQK